MTDNLTFGGRLRRTRLAAGLSQSDVAARCGIPKTRLSRYENDHILPSLQSLHRVAGALGVSESALLGESTQEMVIFLRTLESRGVRFESPADAERLANEVADHLDAERQDRKSDW